jgi:hypothetical protein
MYSQGLGQAVHNKLPAAQVTGLLDLGCKKDLSVKFGIISSDGRGRGKRGLSKTVVRPPNSEIGTKNVTINDAAADKAELVMKKTMELEPNKQRMGEGKGLIPKITLCALGLLMPYLTCGVKNDLSLT